MTAVATGLRHFTRLSDLDPGELEQLLALAARLKEKPSRYEGTLHGRTIACIFEKPSTRTRVSFASAAAELSALPITLSPQELQIGRGETIADTARSLSGYCAAIVARTFAQETVDELAAWATVPVINALSDRHHPCQALADLLTIQETRGSLAGRRLAFVGDGGNNVASPPEHAPDAEILDRARHAALETGAELTVTDDPQAAVAGADAVYADVWTSMGDEAEHDERVRMLAPYQVTDELMALADPEAVFLHCLPAHRGEEVAASVIDGPRSAVWLQSANRLPTEAALLLVLVYGFHFR